MKDGRWGRGRGGEGVICCSVILTDLTVGCNYALLGGEACMTVEKTDGILRNEKAQTEATS